VRVDARARADGGVHLQRTPSYKTKCSLMSFTVSHLAQLDSHACHNNAQLPTSATEHHISCIREEEPRTKVMFNSSALPPSPMVMYVVPQAFSVWLKTGSLHSAKILIQ